MVDRREWTIVVMVIGLILALVGAVGLSASPETRPVAKDFLWVVALIAGIVVTGYAWIRTEDR